MSCTHTLNTGQTGHRHQLWPSRVSSLHLMTTAGSRKDDIRCGRRERGRACLDDGGDEASVRHGDRKGDVHALVVGDAVAIWGAGCTRAAAVRRG